MIGYKVFRQYCTGRLYSFYGLPGTVACYDYTVGETHVTSKGYGPMAAFSTEEAAREYLRRFRNDNSTFTFEIYEVEYTYSSECVLHTPDEVYGEMGWRECPAGTIFAEEVTPLRKLTCNQTEAVV